MSDEARAVQELYQYRDRALALVAQLRKVRDELNGAIDATLDRERETADLAVAYEAERDALALQLQAKQDALADALPELTAAAELIGKVRQMVAFHAPYLDIANAIDAWMKVEPPDERH